MNHLTRTYTSIFLFVLMLTTAVGHAAEIEKKKQRPKSQPNPAFVEFKDIPSLPRVLLIGDSISIGYTIPVRKLLEGKANVHRPPTNCGPTTRGIAEIDGWLGKGEWDVIHFNWGLHDLKYMGPDGQNRTDPNAPDSRQQVPIDQYKTNLEKLVTRLKQTKAKLIWRTTTPVPPGSQGRVPGDAAKYNAVAKKIMDEHNIEIDDQYAFAMQRLEELQRPGDVHFTPKGSEELAKQAVTKISNALAE
ncbi:SGNH/GDSL hydrolase family protein [Bythopirellula polymerisocia]|uniref:GDSL-like Lipase/Acylhydrolase n=1 Tax=Bythopirellula polymerisocia TaxID=2528003 RepID=A0A5C6CVM7_9BACT|nr:SGNH/GDSL hydrolase family protein [Bythopirellula polymerisocia]TWU27501.1 GDSL-like Lipase/Acylhydrolase [Bythopirellula polymerisocia]